MVVESKEFSDRACDERPEQVGRDDHHQGRHEHHCLQPADADAHRCRPAGREGVGAAVPVAGCRDREGRGAPGPVRRHHIFIATDVPSLGYKTFSVLPPSVAANARRLCRSDKSEPPHVGCYELGKSLLPHCLRPCHRRHHQHSRQAARRRTGRSDRPAQVQRVSLRALREPTGPHLEVVSRPVCADGGHPRSGRRRHEHPGIRGRGGQY